MRARPQHDLHQGCGVAADRGGFALDPLVRPVAVAPVRTRHVSGHRAGSIRAQVTQMRGDQLAAMEDFHRLRRDPRFHFLAQQPERHRVEMPGDLDVVVEVDPAPFPVGVFVWRRWQR